MSHERGDLFINEEGHEALLDAVFEDEKLIVVAELADVGYHHFVQGGFHAFQMICQLGVIVLFSLVDFSLQDFRVYSFTQCWRHTAFGKLHHEGLVVLIQQLFAYENPLIHKRLFLIDSDLPQRDVELVELAPQLLQGPRMHL